ncbi:unnamed protein product [Ilex paraguariensis]|uniref:Uncharacterized protein n=1 Tax=Ilex paraguariensis TaxID=185542 RepID=A0ABC8TGE5_9AQUA
MMGRCSISSSSNTNEVNLFKSLTGIQQLVETRQFKAWFLDQFGVLHDGKQPYPGAISTLEKLATSGAKMVIISNSSRRASTTMEKLKSLGFDPSLFVGAITSGELTYQHLQRREDDWFEKLGSCCIHMTWNDRGAVSLEGLGLRVVEYVEEAEFVLAHGTEALGLSSGAAVPMKLEDLEKILEQCAAKRIPMVVANPDFVTVEARALRVMPVLKLFRLMFSFMNFLICTSPVIKKSSMIELIVILWHIYLGYPFTNLNTSFLPFFTISPVHPPPVSSLCVAYVLVLFLGTLAATYEKLGGEVKWMGKPDKIIYKSAMAMVDEEASDCIAVGDSLHHDIKGANAAQICSAFITGGIHATELGLGKFGEVADQSSAHALSKKYDAYPSYILPSFTW